MYFTCGAAGGGVGVGGIGADWSLSTDCTCYSMVIEDKHTVYHFSVRRGVKSVGGGWEGAAELNLREPLAYLIILTLRDGALI